jgi:hypothetical protein
LHFNHEAGHLFGAAEMRASVLQKPKLTEEIIRTVINSFFQFQSVGAALLK